MQRLVRLGLHGSMLSAIVQMYWEVPVVPKCGHAFSPAFPSTSGVKQADPLSPLLFGLFIDVFESWLQTRLPEVGFPVSRSLVVQMLLYADDMVLTASTASALQQQLDLLSEFCRITGMEVNLSKTEIVVFRKRPSRGSQEPPLGSWTFQGHPLQVSSQFRYLGVILHEFEGMRAAMEPLATASRKAMWAMIARLNACGVQDIRLKTRLLQSLVLPITTYCSEVWAPSLLQQWGKLEDILANPLQQVHTSFLRLLGNLRASTSTVILLREFGATPVAKHWLQSSSVAVLAQGWQDEGGLPIISHHAS